MIPTLQAGRDQDSSAGFWSMYLQGAFQYASEADHDPDDETERVGDAAPLGATPGSMDGSFIFCESIRELERRYPVDGAKCRAVVPAHELGHQFGLGEERLSRSLMGYCSRFTGAYSTPAELRSIRERG